MDTQVTALLRGGASAHLQSSPRVRGPRRQVLSRRGLRDNRVWRRRRSRPDRRRRCRRHVGSRCRRFLLCRRLLGRWFLCTSTTRDNQPGNQNDSCGYWHAAKYNEASVSYWTPVSSTSNTIDAFGGIGPLPDDP